MKLIDNTGLSYLIGKIETMIGLKADKTYVDNKIKTDTEFMVGRAYDTTEGIIPGNY